MVDCPMAYNKPGATAPSYLHLHIPHLDFSSECSEAGVPDEAACRRLWGEYDMMPHIGAHSEQVAGLAHALARRAADLGKGNVRALTLASGLLHDIAKSYTVRYGGSHAQLGASWVMTRTGNPVIAQAVLHHVWWPWDFPKDLASPVFFVLYADKRVMHDTIVPLEERYEDLLVRYGHTDASRAAIVAGNEHAQRLERALSAFLEMPLHAYTFTGGRLVERT